MKNQKEKFLGVVGSLLENASAAQPEKTDARTFPKKGLSSLPGDKWEFRRVTFDASIEQYDKIQQIALKTHRSTKEVIYAAFEMFLDAYEKENK
jgi:hypothetical protein